MSLRDDGYCFAEEALLVYLLRNGPSTMAEIAKGTGFSLTALRGNMHGCLRGSAHGGSWVYLFREDRPVEYALTDTGRKIAGYRVRRTGRTA